MVLNFCIEIREQEQAFFLSPEKLYCTDYRVVDSIERTNGSILLNNKKLPL